MSYAAELATEIMVIAAAMRAHGVTKLKTEKVEIELGALPLAPQKPKREFTDAEYAVAATEGLPLDDEADNGS